MIHESADLRQIVGKTIRGVVVKDVFPRDGRPGRAQFFLIFDDDTSFEVYTNPYIRFSGLYDNRGFEYLNTPDPSRKIEYSAYLDENGNLVEQED